MNILDSLKTNLFTMTYNGIDLIEWFLIQEVKGRGVLSKESTIRTIDGVDGAVITSEWLPPRTLEVDAIIYADGPEELRKKIEELSFVLNTSIDVPIVFSDEKDRKYYGRFQTADEGKEVDNFHIVTLKFYCQNPLKEGDAVSQTIETAGTLVKNEGFADVWPLISCSFSEPASEYKVTLTNGTITRLINIKFDFIAGDILEVDSFKRTVLLNGKDRKTALQIDSTWIKMEAGEEFTATASQVSTMSYTKKYK